MIIGSHAWALTAASWRTSTATPTKRIAIWQKTAVSRTSIQLDVGVLDHLSPKGKLRLDEVA
jgi:hypothetical protein